MLRVHHVLAQSSVTTMGIGCSVQNSATKGTGNRPVLRLCVLPLKLSPRSVSWASFSRLCTLSVSSSLPEELSQPSAGLPDLLPPLPHSLPFLSSVLISYHFFSSHQGLGCQGLAVHKDVGKAGDGGVLEHSFCTV